MTSPSSSSSGQQHSKVKLLDKLKKGVTRPATPRFHSVPILHVKAHESEVLIPDPKAKSTSPGNSSMGKMVNCAFELKDETQGKFIHPIDQPITLKNGKNIYPSGAASSPTANKIQNSQVDVANDMFNLLSILMDNVTILLKYIWNLDLYINVSLSNNSKLRLHVPSISGGLITLKVLLSTLSSKSSASLQSSNGSGIGLFNIIIVCCVGYYLLTKLKSNHNPVDNHTQHSAFNTENAKTIPRIPDLTSFDNPRTRTRPTEYDIIHRNQIPKPELLNINSPLSKDSINRRVMKRLTDDGRDEMLKLFN